MTTEIKRYKLIAYCLIEHSLSLSVHHTKNPELYEFDSSLGYADLKYPAAPGYKNGAMTVQLEYFVESVLLLEYLNEVPII